MRLLTLHADAITPIEMTPLYMSHLHHRQVRVSRSGEFTFAKLSS